MDIGNEARPPPMSPGQVLLRSKQLGQRNVSVICRKLGKSPLAATQSITVSGSSIVNAILCRTHTWCVDLELIYGGYGTVGNNAGERILECLPHQLPTERLHRKRLLSKSKQTPCYVET